MRDRTDWVRDTTGGPIKVGRKTYANLVRFTRACATCGQPFSIHVTKKIADGHADSNSFGLRNCENHRRASVSPEVTMANNVMKQELDGCYATIKELRARLALYELPAAMAVLDDRAALGLPPRHAPGTAMAAANGQNKMPWE